ncbi:MAG: hypothetical protein HQL77_18725 [Magnetococcales bacterium]|nr:hypothetical protein [Magnetococcales bacterium]
MKRQLKQQQQKDEVLLKSHEVRRRFGGISSATLYRFWNKYSVLPPPKKLRDQNYWPERVVDDAVKTVGGV